MCVNISVMNILSKDSGVVVVGGDECGGCGGGVCGRGRLVGVDRAMEIAEDGRDPPVIQEQVTGKSRYSIRVTCSSIEKARFEQKQVR